MGGIVKSVFGGGSSEPQIIIQEAAPAEKNITENADEIRRRAVNASGYSNINTSTKGVLETIPELPKRKTLLGE
jgi:hypothetical protein